jgi:hypothetical protein
MTTPLSFAAQAIWDAWNDAYEVQGPLEGMGQPIAAALRAALDQVVPEQPTIPNGDLTEQTYRWDKRSGIRRKLLAIAAKLEGANG